MNAPSSAHTTPGQRLQPRVTFRVPSFGKSQDGFTLLELLVAMTVFAIMAVATYSGLRSVLFNQTAVEAQAQRLGEVQMAFYLLAQDIQQTLPRFVIDEYGDRQPALESNEINDDFLRFTRAGWDNPLGQQRASLQRLAYRLEQRSLLRLYWDTLDRSGIGEPRRATLLEDVETVEVRFLDADNAWQTQWPATEVGATVALEELPRAVELSITLEDWGTITRLFPLLKP